jgi:hypothetical protein
MNRAERWLLNLMQRRVAIRAITLRRTFDGDFHGGPGGEQSVEWCLGCGDRRVFDQWGTRPRYGDWHEPRSERAG